MSHSTMSSSTKSSSAMSQIEPQRASKYSPCPPGQFCAVYPCKHISCHDRDYLADLQDRYDDPRYHSGLWRSFRHPYLRARISCREWDGYKVSLDRCQRLRNKWPEINKQIKAFQDTEEGKAVKAWREQIPWKYMPQREWEGIVEKELSLWTRPAPDDEPKTIEPASYGPTYRG